MLKHNSQLKKLYNKAPKIKKGGIERLDNRYTATHKFEEALVDMCIKSFKKSNKL